jgi:5-hydroxyisourate hydrolase-like protein (transthyretin family)
MLAAIVGVLVVGMSAATAQPAVGPATITGVVSNADGTPQEGVVVDLFRRGGAGNTSRGEFLDFARTDAEGRYSFEVESNRNFVLVFIAPEGQNFGRSQYLRRAVQSTDGQVSTVDASLSRTTDAVIGGLLIDEDGRGWAGRATLFVAGADGSRSTYLGATDTSGTDGSFQFEVVPGCYVIDIEHGNLGFDGRRWFQTQACVESGETNLSIRAVLTGVIRADIGGVISIENEDGELEPAEGIKVDLYIDFGLGREFFELVYTGADGRYTFNVGVFQCWLMVGFAPEGYSFGGSETFEREVCVSGPSTDNNATLRPPPRPPTIATLGGTIDNRTTDGPAEGVKVTFWASTPDGQRGQYLGEELSDADGAFTFEVDSAGCFWLVFVAPEGDGFSGERYLERTACVELGDEVSDLDATIDGADGLPTPSISVSNTTVVEPDTGSVIVNVPVVLEAEDDDLNVLTYRVRSYSSATNNTDFSAPEQGQLRYEPGETVKTIPIEVFGDTDYEQEAEIGIFVTNPGTSDPGNGGGPFVASGRLVIEDNDPFTPLTASISDQSAYEGTGERPVQPGGLTYNWRLPLEFNREVQLNEAVQIDYVLADGSATLADADYAEPRFGASPIRVAAGARTIAIPLVTLGDDVVEPDETLTVQISTTSEQLSLINTEATFTILDDDGTQAPTASVTVEADSTDFESDSGFRLNLPVTFRLSEPADFQRFVWWSTVDGTATYADRDFMDTIIGGWIPAGATEMTDLMRYQGDDVVEPDETFSIVPTEASAGLVFTQESFEFTILNDD